MSCRLKLYQNRTLLSWPLAIARATWRRLDPSWGAAWSPALPSRPTALLFPVPSELAEFIALPFLEVMWASTLPRCFLSAQLGLCTPTRFCPGSSATWAGRASPSASLPVAGKSLSYLLSPAILSRVFCLVIVQQESDTSADSWVRIQQETSQQKSQKTCSELIIWTNLSAGCRVLPDKTSHFENKIKQLFCTHLRRPPSPNPETNKQKETHWYRTSASGKLGQLGTLFLFSPRSTTEILWTFYTKHTQEDLRWRAERGPVRGLRAASAGGEFCGSSYIPVSELKKPQPGNVHRCRRHKSKQNPALSTQRTRKATLQDRCYLDN